MSRNRPTDLLVCYDIRQPRRLRRVHRCMRRWGMPLQYSVFYCNLSDRARRKLECELRALINESVDDIRIYGLKAHERIQFMGRKPLPDGLMVLGTSVLENLSDR
ncbi:MAG: CRISPR-associated endonuclease Cas2 [Salinisphaera sp.]|nr:CRISPR-associated endonuclease Cas2 [Salinisphaera sp.]